MQINKSTRHQKIVGDFGEHLVCNWLSRSGFEVSRVDHTGIDVVAYNPTAKQRYGITVKARTRTRGTEAESVYVFRHDDRKKMLSACKAFGCKPWIAVYVESECAADLYLTSLANYDRKYRTRGKRTEDWKMTSKQMHGYTADAEVKHIRIAFSDENWWQHNTGKKSVGPLSLRRGQWLDPGLETFSAQQDIDDLRRLWNEAEKKHGKGKFPRAVTGNKKA